MKLLIAEKPSVAQEIAAVVGADKRHSGYLEGNGWLVSWCYGHLVELADPSAYDPALCNGNWMRCPSCRSSFERLSAKVQKTSLNG